VGEVLRSDVTQAVIRGTVESVIDANTDLSDTETAALAGVVATMTRSLVAKPLEAYISKKLGA
jgi:hypothetical protein